jgi:hypothetical protein
MTCHLEKYKKKKKGYKITEAGELGDEVILEPVGDV